MHVADMHMGNCRQHDIDPFGVSAPTGRNVCLRLPRVNVTNGVDSNRLKEERRSGFSATARCRHKPPNR
jgi:hypothetical protein